MLDIFEILGPVMIGPSSSHTAGAAKIGAMARTLLGAPPVRAAIHLYGSACPSSCPYMRPAGFRSSIADELNCYTGQASLCVGTVTVRALAA